MNHILGYFLLLIPLGKSEAGLPIVRRRWKAYFTQLPQGCVAFNAFYIVNVDNGSSSNLINYYVLNSLMTVSYYIGHTNLDRH